MDELIINKQTLRAMENERFLEIQLNEKQKEAYNAIVSGRSLLLTGSAGTGKTSVIKLFYQLKQDPNKKIALTSTTGVSAVLVGGTTLHSYLGIGLGTNSTEKLVKKIKSSIFYKTRWLKLETLIIDEVSMMSPELFDKLELMARLIRKSKNVLETSEDDNYNKPFGGIQLVLSGDFCFGKDTEILMYDGTIKKVQDIWVGDLVMGDDGNARKVSAIFRGESQLFELTFPRGGEKIIVTGNHTLCLKNTIHKRIHFFQTHNSYTVFFWDDETKLLKTKSFGMSKFKTKDNALKEAENFVETLPDVDVIEMTVNEYLALPKNSSDRLTCYKVGIENWLAKSQTELLIDPWLLGAWLGDGNSDGKGFTNADDECIKEFISKLEEMDCRVEKSKVYVIKNQKDKKCSPFKEALKKYNLFNNKHIPDEFMFSSVENRFKLLAGLLDTDGYLCKNTYQISQTRETLSRQICFLARSLGLSCSIKYVEQSQKIQPNKNYGPYENTCRSWRCHIGGDIDKIPCCLERRKAKKILNRQYDSINMKPQIKLLDKGDFYGFELDGNRRFLLGDFTVSHNCQLPVVRNDRFVFEAKSWDSCVQKTCYLEKIIRQDDPVFQKCLNEVRIAKLSDETIDILSNCSTTDLTNELGIRPTRIYPVNSAVDKVNTKALAKLQGEFREYEMEIKIHKIKYFDQVAKYKKGIKAVEKLELAENAQVMLLANLDVEGGLVNGSRGVVVGFVEDIPRVRFMNGQEKLIDYHEWDIEEIDVKVATIYQVPLKLAYACTVHSSQGLSLDCVEINMANFFEYGQAYVALSRVRSLAGLRIKNFDEKLIKAHPTAFQFYANLNKIEFNNKSERL